MFRYTQNTKCVYFFVLAFMARLTDGLLESVRCSTDRGPEPPDGVKSGNEANGWIVEEEHFGWLGVIQHAFYIAKSTQYAVTTGVLIHPGFVLASAEDIGKISAEDFANNTKYILWGSDGAKHVVEVYDYVLHPEYTSQQTSATIALVRLHRWATGRRISVGIWPICLPLRGLSDIESIYVIKLTDVNMKMEKEMIKVNYVPDKECEDFYFKAGLSMKDKAPMHSMCAKQGGRRDLCLWEAGAVLATKLNFAHWTVLGFGVRGPGCGAPARFIMVHRYLPWLDDIITAGPEVKPRRRSGAGIEKRKKLMVRQYSPTNMTLYKPEIWLPSEMGQCSRKHRGSIQYKDAIHLVTSGYMGIAYYFLEIQSTIMFTCLTVNLHVVARSMAGVWIEHNCPGATTGLAPLVTSGPSLEYETCFYYWKTTAYVELRFQFSAYATAEVIMYGMPLLYTEIDPWPRGRTSTEAWQPTRSPARIMYNYFIPWLWNILY